MPTLPACMHGRKHPASTCLLWRRAWCRSSATRQLRAGGIGARRWCELAGGPQGAVPAVSGGRALQPTRARTARRSGSRSVAPTGRQAHKQVSSTQTGVKHTNRRQAHKQVSSTQTGVKHTTCKGPSPVPPWVKLCELLEAAALQGRECRAADRVEHTRIEEAAEGTCSSRLPT